MRKIRKKYQELSVQMKASLWYLFCGLLQKGITLLTTPIYTRIMTQTEYGQFNVYLSWFGILGIFISLNLSYSVYLQGLVKYEHDKDAFTSSLVGLTTLLAGVSLAVYLGLHRWINPLVKLSTPIMICMILSTWTEAIFGFWSGRQRNDYTYRPLVILTVAVAVAKPLVAIASIYAFPGYGLEARVISMTLIELIAYAWIFVRQVRMGRPLYHKFYWKYAVLYNLPLIPHYLSQTVLSSSDRIMIANMAGEDSAAIYGLAYSLGMIMTIVNTALSNTFTPWIYQRIKREQYGNIGWYSYMLIALVACANLLLIAFAPEVIRIFAPQTYYEAIWLIPPIAMGTYFMFMYNIFANFAFYFEKTKAVTLGSCAGAILNVVLNFAFIGMYGYQAAAYTTFFCYMLYAIGHYLFMRYVCRRCIKGRDVRIFDVRIIAAISAVFMLIAFAIMQLYDTCAVRYAVFAAFAIALAAKRNEIIRRYRQLKGERNG